MKVSIHDVATRLHAAIGTDVTRWQNGFDGDFYLDLGLPDIATCVCGEDLQAAEAFVAVDGLLRCVACASNTEFATIGQALAFVRITPGESPDSLWWQS